MPGQESPAPVARGGRGGAANAEPNPRPYRRVVTAEAKTRKGMFDVHQVGSQFLFEIPREQLGKDELLVTEIAKTTLGVGYGGQAISNRVYRWELRNNRVYLRSISYEVMADSTTPEYQAVQNSNVPAIIADFNVESYGPDSSVVIDVTKLFTQPPQELGPGTRIPGNVDAQRSWIERATPFPDNVNVYATLTYAQNPGRGGAAAAPGRGGFGQAGTTRPSNTIVMSWSFHRLPDVPMMPRYCDDRVGYFSVRLTDYTDTGDMTHARCFITRYRLEKKDPSKAVSDPVKPIVYYIDPATPKKWIPWFKKAIEDWQPAFEAAGFSHAIIAKEAPDDPDWSPEDARYSVVRWLPSTTENASGPNVHDPRSGEILEAHIQFYQNVQHLQLSWYFTQAAAVDPRARVFPFPDSLMGRLLEYVLTHEVGHTIGFQHNMKASAEYPTDSLRSVAFLRKYGHTPTLMDYSRFNYLVQPEDNIPVELLTPVQGPYDIWATHWGYAPIPDAKTPEEERATLDQWAREQDTVPWYRFSTSGAQGSDPGEETEAVGDQDAVKATGWGLRNIKREVQYLIPATTANKTENYDELNSLYGRLVGQWRTELAHVTNVVGGAASQDKYPSQQGVLFTPVEPGPPGGGGEVPQRERVRHAHVLPRREHPASHRAHRVGAACLERAGEHSQFAAPESAPDPHGRVRRPRFGRRRLLDSRHAGRRAARGVQRAARRVEDRHLPAGAAARVRREPERQAQPAGAERRGRRSWRSRGWARWSAAARSQAVGSVSVGARRAGGARHRTQGGGGSQFRPDDPGAHCRPSSSHCRRPEGEGRCRRRRVATDN